MTAAPTSAKTASEAREARMPRRPSSQPISLGPSTPKTLPPQPKMPMASRTDGLSAAVPAAATG